MSATNVSYKLGFTPATNAGALVVDFCSNTPVIGEACTAPTGFSLSALGAEVTTGAFTDENVVDANTIRITGGLTAATPVEIDITKVNNPTTTGTIYARVVTYDTAANANAYDSEAVAEGVAGATDIGGVAISITPTIEVSAAVLESIQFCMSKGTIGANCDLTGANAYQAPILKLGNEIETGVFALDSQSVYTGVVNTQLSTNAAGGAVVHLKSNATNCGGLLRAGAPGVCNIGPATGGDILAGDAEFGVKTGAAVTDANGTIQPAGAYNATTYALGYNAGGASGVTSTYGDLILNTNNAPANNRNMPLTFGASAANNTPAGNYSASLSLIATGKF